MKNPLIFIDLEGHLLLFGVIQAQINLQRSLL